MISPTCSPRDYAAGISAFGALPMAFFAFDVEPGNGPGGSNCNGSGSTIIPVTSAEVAAVQADGIRPVIYSFPDGWQGGSGFTNIPLWASQDNSRITLLIDVRKLLTTWHRAISSPPGQVPAPGLRLFCRTHRGHSAEILLVVASLLVSSVDAMER